MVKDLSYIMAGWPADPGATPVRKFVAPDGLAFIQVRVDLGVLQMALDGRPDGERPGGHDTMLDRLRERIRQYEELAAAGEDARLLDISASDWQALLRELLQYYRRRVSLITLAQAAEAQDDREEAADCYLRAIRDADHNLSILDFLRDHCSRLDEMETQEPYRPFILTQRAICQAQYAQLMHDPDAAIETLKTAIAEIKACAGKTIMNDAGEGEPLDTRVFVAELQRLERRIRREHRRRRTLSEQLEDALAAEDYEKAARLRDEMSAQARQPENRDEK